MNCSKCGIANQPKANFCANCGAPLTGGATPPAQQRLPTNAISLVVAALCLLYLLNPTAGLFELIPDNLPVIGNLDEAMATAGLLWALRSWGVRLPGL